MLALGYPSGNIPLVGDWSLQDLRGRGIDRAHGGNLTSSSRLSLEDIWGVVCGLAICCSLMVSVVSAGCLRPISPQPLQQHFSCQEKQESNSSHMSVITGEIDETMMSLCFSYPVSLCFFLCSLCSLFLSCLCILTVLQPGPMKFYICNHKSGRKNIVNQSCLRCCFGKVISLWHCSAAVCKSKKIKKQTHAVSTWKPKLKCPLSLQKHWTLKG